jgi:hypothetical protein
MEKMLTREQILAHRDLPTEEVFSPGLGGSLRVRGMTARERDQFESSRVTRKNGKVQIESDNTRAKMVAICVVDPEGGRLFSDEDVPALGNLPADVLDPIFEVAARLSGMRPEDLEDARKNSDARSGAFSSD